MSAFLIMLFTFVGYIIVYRLYGKFIGKKIFNISVDAPVPSVELEDGIDYVPAKKEIIFGHHFTSIAGTGPIVGPAIAIIWGWVPALIWIFVGSIIMGGIHDFGALIISMRNKGQSIAECATKYISTRTRFFFFLIVFMELWIIIAVFGMIIAIVFSMYPTAVLPVWLQILIALGLGYMIYKRGANVLRWSIVSVVLMYITIVIGTYFPLVMPQIAGIPPTGVWTIILLIYAFCASVLPVTMLLQPRDYINSHQLVIAMVLLVIGVIAATFSSNLEIVAPAVQINPAGSPPMWPFLFITIACGAISGFHSLVSSGTSAKQVRNETDSLFVGYGSMLMEGALATIVLIAVAAGIGMGYVAKDGQTLTGVPAWTEHYSSWAAAGGLTSKISAFVDGSANMIAAIGISRNIAIVIMGVFVASFAGTTLDTATRIQRYVISELFNHFKLKFLAGRFTATLIAVVTALFLAFATGAGGKGALILWPLFGATNQALAALALIVVTFYLKSRGGFKWLFSAIPALFMALITIWALCFNQSKFITSGSILLQVLNLAILIIAVWIVAEGFIKFFKRGDKSLSS